MQDIKGQDLKTILHSKRANIYYLEHCRVLVNGGRVEYVTAAGKRSLYWNIPHCQHHQHPAGHRHLHHAGGHAGTGQGGRAGRLLRRRWNAFVQRQ